MTEEKKTPEVIEDKDLDDASGGIGMLLPAVQKVREAAATTSTPKTTGSANNLKQLTLGATAGDGSV